MSNDGSPARVRRIPHRAIILSGLLIAGATIWLLDGGHRLFRPKRLGVVEEGFLWRSGQIHRRLLPDVLLDNEIDVVIDLSKDDPDDADDMGERKILDRLGIERLAFEDLQGDATGNVESYVAAMKRLVRAQNEGERVLVHCSGGSERTGAVVAWYRMLFQGWSGDAAWDEYLSYRSRPPKDEIHPTYVNAHTATLVRRLLEDGVAVPHPEPGRFGP